MLKYAFIMNIPGETPETYCGTYENKESISKILGTDGMDATKEIMKKLAGEGYTLFDLCGDFDDDMRKELQESIKENIKVSSATYENAQMAALEKLPALSEYGVIVAMDGVSETEEVVIKSSECNSYVKFVKDMDEAKKAAGALVKEGAVFIELCSWFDKAKTKEIIEAINGAIPVGTCGA